MIDDVRPTPFVENNELREWLEQEIRWAMRQELDYNGMSGLNRHGIARVRARRILAKLDGFHVPDKKVIRSVEITDAVSDKMNEIREKSDGTRRTAGN